MLLTAKRLLYYPYYLLLTVFASCCIITAYRVALCCILLYLCILSIKLLLHAACKPLAGRYDRLVRPAMLLNFDSL